MRASYYIEVGSNNLLLDYSLSFHSVEDVVTFMGCDSKNLIPIN